MFNGDRVKIYDKKTKMSHRLGCVGLFKGDITGNQIKGVNYTMIFYSCWIRRPKNGTFRRAIKDDNDIFQGKGRIWRMVEKEEKTMGRRIR